MANNSSTEDFKLTPEQEAQIEPWAQKYIDFAFRTGKLSDEDKARAERGIRGIYRGHDLKEPKRISWSPSPYTAACAFGVSEVLIDASELSAKDKVATARTVVKERIELAMARLAASDLDAAPTETESTAHAQSDALRIIGECCGLDMGAVGGKVAEEYLPQIRECIRTAHDAANAGNQASAWIAHVNFFRDVVKFEADYSKWNNYDDAGFAGPRFMHEDFTIVCDLPTILSLDPESRPHSQTGPSHAWSDGWKIYTWRGTRVPSNWIENPASIDPMAAIRHRNIEQRRCAAEILGWDKIISLLNPKVIDKNPDPEIGTLLEVDVPDAGIQRFLRVRCGTGRNFSLPVPARYNTALEANAATYSLQPQELVKLEFRT